jgi:anaerobic selenocysteine-containing dehydrogenase
VKAELLNVPVAEYAARADVGLADVEAVARGFATAKRACVRVDLGTQHTLHTTLNAYLEKLLYLITGHFGRIGGNNLHTLLLPLIGNTDETTIKPGKSLRRTACHGMMPIAGMYPPNILPDEILRAGERRIRAVMCDSSNPLLTYADTQAQEEAFRALDLLVVIDVAMTETARLAHYVLPAASQFEKVEATGFTLEFPQNTFHLRRGLLPPLAEALPEPEIYTRLLEKMGMIPRRFPMLSAIARAEPKLTGHLAYLSALRATLRKDRHWAPFAASIMYRTLGAAMPQTAAAAALLPLAIAYAREHAVAVRRAGHAGNSLTLGANLFRAIIAGQSGIVLSRHEHDEMWSLLKTSDRRVHLHIPEMVEALRDLAREVPPQAAPSFILMAGERRSYNANQIFRDPDWRKTDKQGAMRMHPDDARSLGLADGDPARCQSDRAGIDVVIEFDDSVRRGVVSLPHGYGNRYQGGTAAGPVVNLLTSLEHCDPLSRTPYHKYIPVRISRHAASEPTAV